MILNWWIIKMLFYPYNGILFTSIKQQNGGACYMDELWKHYKLKKPVTVENDG